MSDPALKFISLYVTALGVLCLTVGYLTDQMTVMAPGLVVFALGLYLWPHTITHFDSEDYSELFPRERL